MLDEELRAWAGTWQSAAPDLAPLRTRAGRQSRRLAFLVAGDILICVVGLALSAWLLASDRLVYVVSGAALVLLCVAGLVFTATNWRGAWREPGESASEFLRLMLLRSRALVRWLWFGVWLLAAEVALFIVLIGLQWRTTLPSGRLAMIALLAALTAVAGLALAWFLRRARARADALGRLAAALDGYKE